VLVHTTNRQQKLTRISPFLSTKKSDDETIANHLRNEWTHRTGMGEKHIKFVVRASPNFAKMNELFSLESNTLSLVEILVDLRILVAVDILVSSSTLSSMADLAYYLRGGHNAYNVDNFNHGWKWSIE